MRTMRSVDDEAVIILLTTLADMRSDVKDILWELRDGEEEEEPKD
jgi:hypothetical protein